MSLKEYISRTASEWIGGIKRFISFPYGPKTTPEDDYQLINRLYADGMVTSLSVSISNALSSISASLGGISTFLTSEVMMVKHMQQAGGISISRSCSNRKRCMDRYKPER